jgi:hypothetical protein
MLPERVVRPAAGPLNPRTGQSPQIEFCRLNSARLGLAAIDFTGPLPFTALRRPALADLAKDLLRKRDDEA